ncbi:hypothetical protein BCV69DRAFT_279776 [Microstroma glucosiphilum]|uniref:Uncharacterized protein n=1 Tax=Pseudomicrostroma glucosiphilum TaxID=1684307 RepID=A0A316UF34_9BASI|nr:hypothetical protein BCV69DRAFT_279776 [Pseudomicrostroma glucosiphilum]PWN23866.1 hypothetical protein BCV69DRAFT_279776 [Pseudomicrostroma glucosiphilum]
MADPSPRARPISSFDPNGNAQESTSYRNSSDWTRSGDWGASANSGSGPSQPFRREPGSRPSSSGLDKAVQPPQAQANPSSSMPSSPRSSFMVINNGQSSKMGSASPAASPVASRRVTPQTSFSGPPPGAATPFSTHSRRSSGNLMSHVTGVQTPDPAGSSTTGSTPRAPYRMEGQQQSRQAPALSGWSLSQIPHFGSSADAYAPLPVLPASGRQGGNSYDTTLGAQDDAGVTDRGQRSGAVTPGGDSYGTHFTNESVNRDARRASRHSFQTAASGLDSAPSADGLRDARGRGIAGAVSGDRFEEVKSTDDSRRPAGSSPLGYASSTERAVPGSWGFQVSHVRSTSSPLVETKPLTRPTPPSSVIDEQFASAKNSPLIVPSVLPPPTTRARQAGPERKPVGGAAALGQTSASPSTGSRFEEWELKQPGQGSNASRPSSIGAPGQLGREQPALAMNGAKPSPRLSIGNKEQPPVPSAARESEIQPSTPISPTYPASVESTTVGPAVPDKGNGIPAGAPPPTPPKISGSYAQAPLSRRPELALDVAPPTLPRDAAPDPEIPPQTSPVSDYRRRPLADSNFGSPALKPSIVGPGIGAHNVTAAGALVSTSPPSPEDMRMQRSSTAGLLPRAALVEGPGHDSAEPSGRAESVSSVDTPSREPSPPPEGEVEARAEWERARMKQKQKRSTKNNARRSTLRGQLKPLQMVSTGDNGNAGQEASRELGGEPAALKAFAPSAKPNSGAMSTQQLQKQQARDQRRSVGAINMTMGAMGGADVASGVNGPYPMFPSPSQGATPGRQYLGMLPQRSLVPPFELQQRPDGLLSGLIGPDGVRRSVNDPEVCLECMMRDEDMIDVDVLGPGLWERESDRDFDEALRIEREEGQRNQSERGGTGTGPNSGSAGTGDDLSAAGHSSTDAASREGPSRNTSLGTGTKIRVKRVGKHDALTAERLKLHTQMNPPASSHRWRTLQQFLAVQAKYIAIEQKLLQDEWNRSHGGPGAGRRDRSVTAPGNASVSESVATSTEGGGGRRSPETAAIPKKSMSKNRSVPLLMPQRAAKLVGDEDLRPEEKTMREKDVALAREARRRNAGSTSPSIRNMAGSAMPVPGSASVPGSQTMASVLPRRPGGFSTPGRTASASDLRGVPGSMLSPAIPSTPESLAPPNAAFASGSLGTPKGFGASTVSQLSLAPSGSMLDMHLAMASSNQADHRAGHGSALPMHSPSQLSKPAQSPEAYFGFPGDGEMSPIDPSGPYRQDTIRPDGLRSPPIGDTSRDDGGYFKQKKRDTKTPSTGKEKGGFKRFMNKLAGGGQAGNGLSSPPLDGRSEDSNSQRARRTSVSADDALAPPPGIAGLLSRARRSTSSLLGGADSVESPRELYMQPPMSSNSRNRFDMGPFQSPLPPERKQSRFTPEERATSPLVGTHRRGPSNSYFAGVGPQFSAGGPYPGPGGPASMQSADPRYSSQGSAMYSNGGAAAETPGSSRTPSMMSVANTTTTSSGPQPQRQLHRKQAPVGSMPGGQGPGAQQQLLSPGGGGGYEDGERDSRRPSVMSLNSVVPGRPDRSPRRTDEAGFSMRQVSSPASLPRQQQNNTRGLFGPLTTPRRGTPNGGDYNPEEREEMQDEGNQMSTRGVKDDNRKSKLLRLPFGFSNSNNDSSSTKAKRRTSSALPTSFSSNSGLANSGAYYGEAIDEGGGTPPLRHRASTNALETGMDDESKPRKSMNLFERPRVFSSTSSSGLTSVRSQSAFGNYEPAPQTGNSGGGGSGSGGGGGFASKLRNMRG